MTFHLKKPAIVDISKQGMDNTKKNFAIFWKRGIGGFLYGFGWMFIPGIVMIFMGEAVGGLLAIASVFLFVWFVIYNSNMKSIRNSFWKQLADANGWKYETKGKRGMEKGIMFRQGDRNEDDSGVSIDYCINGNIDNRDFRVFSFILITGGSKRSKAAYSYTVFAFKFQGNFPHFYLNNKRNSFGIDIGNYINLPLEFEDKFLLAAPKEYEIEALEIFTPDALATLLDMGFSYDIEFDNQEMLIFTDGSVNNFDDFEIKLNQALKLVNIFGKKLDNFKFEKIGDLKPAFKFDHMEKSLNKSRMVATLSFFLGYPIFGILFFYLFESIRTNVNYDFSHIYLPITLIYFTALGYFLEKLNRRR